MPTPGTRRRIESGRGVPTRPSVELLAVLTAEPVTRATRFPYIGALDGLRGLLVLSVLIFHYSLLSTGSILFPGSFFAVSTFFTLSGFLITSLLLVETERSGAVAWRGFWGRRFRRLLPASVAVVVIVVVITAGTSPWGAVPGTEVAAALFSYENWWSIHLAKGPDSFRLLGPFSVYWSLAVEEQFYLGLFLMWLAAARTRYLKRWLVGLLVAVGVFSVASAVIVQSTPQRDYFGTDTRAAEMVAGCLLAVAIHHYGWPRARWWGVVGWIAMAVNIAAWSFVREDEEWVLSGGLALFSVVSIGMIVGASVKGTFAKALAFPPLVELGRMSYVVYVVHWPVGLIVTADRTGLDGLALWVARCSVTLGVSLLIFRLLERPIRTARLARYPAGLVLWLAAVAFSIGCSVVVSGWS